MTALEVPVVALYTFFEVDFGDGHATALPRSEGTKHIYFGVMTGHMPRILHSDFISYCNALFLRASARWL